MGQRIRSSLTYANVMVTLLAFIVLGGASYAATGGDFILGKPNTANATSTLSSNVTSGPTLQVTNTGGQPAARFSGSNAMAPFVVNSTAKVANLNADTLDGKNSTGFVSSASLQRVGPVVVGPLANGDSGGAVLATVGNFSFQVACNRDQDIGGDFEDLTLHSAVAHSTFAALSQGMANGVSSADMTAGTSYPLANAAVPDGNPIVDSVSGSAVDPNGKQVDFNLYQAMNARNQPGECIWGGSLVVK